MDLLAALAYSRYAAAALAAHPDDRAWLHAGIDAPLDWDEVPDCEPEDFTLATMPRRFAAIGDPHAGMDDAPGSLEPSSEA